MDTEKNSEETTELEEKNSDISENEESIQINETEEPIERKGMNITVSNDKKLSLKNMSKKKLAIIIGIVLFVLIIFFAVFVCFNKLNTNVFSGVYVLDYDVGGYTSEELKNFLNEKNTANNNKISVIQDTEEIYSFIEDDINLKINVGETVNKVMSFGRDGNIVSNNINILKAKLKKQNLDAVYTYDNEKLDEIVKNIDLSIKNRTEETKYSIDEEKKKLKITIGKSGNGIDLENEKEKIINKLEQKFLNVDAYQKDNKIELDIIKKSPTLLDAKEVYKKVKRDPKDAYINKNVNPAKLEVEVVGLDLDLDELKNSLKNNSTDGKVIEIALKVIEPKVKLEDLSNELFNEKLAGYTTYFNAGQYARANNLKVALAAMNGQIVMPGQTYSYNDNIGDTTAERGYMAAATFKGGTTVDEMGGGICQTVSTLYNVALMANLEIVERHAHGLPVGYVQPSRDATVYSPYLDFKFKNTRANPIKIVTSYSATGSMNVSIYGMKEKDEYEVELISQYLTTVPFTTRYVYDPNLPDGYQEVISYGVNGYTSQSFIKKSLNGVQVSYDLLSKDTYNAQQQVVRLGTNTTNRGS